MFPELLDDGVVHVWSASLERLRPARALAWSLLDGPERERAGRFRFDADRERLVASHGLLRVLLAACLPASPGALSFDRGPHGKPALAGEHEHAGLRFNLSHSGDAVVCALTRVGPVGVDVESVRPLADLERLAARYFSQRESRTVLALPPAERPGAFFACWTRKEAFVKATGAGLSTSLDRFEVSLAPDEPARLLEIDGDAGAAASWSMTGWEEEGHAVAVAVAGPVRRWRRFRVEGVAESAAHAPGAALEFREVR